MAARCAQQPDVFRDRTRLGKHGVSGRQLVHGEFSKGPSLVVCEQVSRIWDPTSTCRLS